MRRLPAAAAVLLAAVLLALPPRADAAAYRLRSLTVTAGERGAVYVELVATGPLSARLTRRTGSLVTFSVWPLLLDRPIVYPVGKNGIVEVRLTQIGPVLVAAAVRTSSEVYVEITAHPSERIVAGLFPVSQEPALAAAAPESPRAPVLPEALPAPGEVIALVEGRARLLSTPGLVRVAVSNPKVADVVTVSDRETILNGLAPGEATLFVWLRNTAPLSYTVRVAPAKPDPDDVLLNALRALAPETVRIAFAGKALVVSGFVDTQLEKERILGAARGAMKDRGEVVDLLEVRSPIQVQLGVRIAEINLMALRETGLEWGMWWPPQQQEGTTVVTTTAPAQGPPPTSPYLFLFTTKGGIFPIQQGEVFFRLAALAQEGKANILATPNVVTVAGKEAKLVVGGQVPVPTGQGSVEFKPFGVVLNATPEVDSAGRISLRLEVSSSELDFTRTVQVAGATLPTMIDRRVTTQVSLLPGETLGIGGLISHITQEQLNKIPILGDLPVLGALFRSRSFQERKTEVVFFVTPQILGREGGGR